jgi:outer membrane lipoprotein-sorting protein
MKVRNMIQAAAAALLPVLCSAALALSEADVRQLMVQNFNATKVSGFNGAVSMKLINAQGKERVRKLNIWSKIREGGTDTEVLMRFDEPADIKGTGFLQIENSAGEDSIWVYLPALGKTRRLVASNRRDSFFGTDFSYGDVLLPAVEKYSHKYLRSETIDGAECHVIESTPADAKTRDDNGYSRKLAWLDPKSGLERKVEYYDLDGKLLKTQVTYEAKEVEPTRRRWMPMRREMVNHQTGHKTIYSFERLELDGKLNDGYFSTRTLER